MVYDLIIIGAGAAGITAGIYGMRSGLSCLVLEQGMVGGQVSQSHMVENYTGIPSISGMDLSVKMHEHLTSQDVKMLTRTVSSVELDGDIKKVVTNRETFESRAVVAANGIKRRTLDVDGEQRLSGRGVSYCAVCDGAFFKDKTVAVVGGGNVALEDALFLSNIAKKVYLIHRRDSFRGEAVLAARVQQRENIEILYDTVVTRINGENKLASVDIKVKSSDSSWQEPNIIKKSQLQLDGLFIAIGITSDNKLYEGQVEMDESGFIKTDEKCQTNLSGVYAAGDCRSKQLRQIITAAADGAIAAHNAFLFVESGR